VYNFDGLEIEVARELIYKRENRKKTPLYKRPDGKFMTVDCPVEAKRRSQFIMVAAAGTALLVAVIVLMILFPPPPPPKPQPQVTRATGEEPQVEMDQVKTEKGADYPKTGHYEAGQPMPADTPEKPAAETSQPVNTQTEPTPAQDTTYSDESGNFWQY
jgi:hypothetical protein